MKLFSDKGLVALYFIAGVASLVAFFAVHKWMWLPMAAIWILLGITQLLQNKNNKLK